MFASVRFNFYSTVQFTALSRCMYVMLNELFISCVFDAPGLHRSTLSLRAVPDTWQILSTALCVCVGGCSIEYVCVLWKVRFSWCLPVNSSFLPSGPVCCLIGWLDTGHLCFLPPPVPTQKHPLFDHFALFDWHICSRCIMVEGGGD